MAQWQPQQQVLQQVLDLLKDCLSPELQQSVHQVNIFFTFCFPRPLCYSV